MNPIEDLLRKTIGLNTGAIAQPLIEQAVNARMRLHGLAQPDGYLRLLHQSRDEWNALVESIVVAETWFFRDREPFRVLARIARDEWLPAHATGRLRLLSAPCSTGEEPYSMAMTLLSAGMPETHFQIDAMDISATAIAAARRAEYGRNSFRGDDLDFRARYFQPAGKFYSLNPSIRSQVHFQIGNLLDDKCLPQTGIYDFIFCRNLLIYFDPPARERLLQKLRRLLTDAGVLFVGSAELPIAVNCSFVPTGLDQSFACRKTAPATLASGRLSHEIVLPPAGHVQATVDLGRARQLANAGRFAEMAEICEAYLRERGVSAEAYYLLGLAKNAAGADSQAGEFYRRALYLEPNHYETLLQWASLKQKNGDCAQARILHGRAERIKNRI